MNDAKPKSDEKRNVPRANGTWFAYRWGADFLANTIHEVRLNPDMPFHYLFFFVCYYGKAGGGISPQKMKGVIRFWRDNAIVAEFPFGMDNTSAISTENLVKPAFSYTSSTTAVQGESLMVTPIGMIGRFSVPGHRVYAFADRATVEISYISLANFVTYGNSLFLGVKSFPRSFE